MGEQDDRLDLNPDGGLATLVDLRIPAQLDSSVSSVPSIILDPSKFRLDRMLKTQHLVYGVPTHHVGRREELELAYNAVRDAVNESKLRLVSIIGGPGTGKTRLLAEMFSIIAPDQRGIRVLSGVCSDTDTSDGLGVVAQLLRRRFDIGHQEVEAVAREKILDALEPLVEAKQLGTAARHLAYLMRTGSHDAGQDEGAVAFERLERRAIGTFYNLLRFQAARAPQILVFHRAQHMTDRASEAIRGLLESLADTPSTVFFVGDVPAAAAVADGAPVHVEIPIEPLPDHDMERLVRNLLQNMDEPPESLVADLVSRASGSPRLAEDNVRLLVQRGVIKPAEDTWTYDAGVHQGSGDLARSMEAASQARIVAMSAELGHVMALASVFGPSFWGSGVLAMLRVRPVGDEVCASVPWFEDEAARWLERTLWSAYEQDLIVPHDPPSLEGQREFSFTHSMDRVTIYESLDPVERALLHRMAAQWFGGLHLQDPAPWYEIIADHLEAGDRSDQAAEWLLKAGKVARSNFDVLRATGLYRRALGLVDVDRMDLLLPVLRGLGMCLIDTGDYREARRVFSALLEGSLTGREREAGAWAWLYLGQVHRSLVDHERARPCFRNASALYEQMGDATGMANVLDQLGKLVWVEGAGGGYDEALKQFERALDLRRRVADPRAIAQSLGSIATIHLLRGRIDEADAEYSEALGLRRSLGDRSGEATTLVGLGAVHHARGDHVKAMESWRRGLELAERLGDRELIAVLLNNLGETHLGLGDLDAAAKQLKQARSIVLDTGDQRAAADILRNLGALALAQGDWDQALTHVDEAIEIAKTTGLRPALGQALCTRARILGQQMDGSESDLDVIGAEASRCYEDAISLFEEAGDVLELRRALADYAVFVTERGDDGRAAELKARADQLEAS